ncbi:MAG: N-acetylmuramoyl-L-alanine amidase [Kocuria sp.]|nr:N-acetylmuramoyl-L-alanine amidase [Kocuria sp.]
MKSRHTPTPSFDRRALLRGTAILGGIAALGTATAAPSWGAGLAAPSSLVSTGSWGAQTPHGNLVTHNYRPTYLVVDQTWTENTNAYSPEDSRNTARAAQESAFAQGQPDSTHHALVTRGGHVMEGRHGTIAAAASGNSFVEGALISGHNTQVVTVLVEGNYSSAWPTQAMYSNLVHISAYLCQQYGIAPGNVRTPLNINGGAVADAHWNQLLEMLQVDITRSLTAGAVRVSLVSSPPSGPGSDFYPTLSLGSEGDAVGRLHELLRARGFDPGTTDTTVMASTITAVRAFQKDTSVAQSSRVDTATWTALEAGAASNTQLQRGSSGADVVTLQRALNARMTAGLPPFGFYNSATESAVIAYQRRIGVVDDGVVSAAVWDALKSGR